MTEQSTFPQALNLIGVAEEADKAADAAYTQAKADFTSLETAYRKRKGLVSSEGLQDLLKKYGPLAAKYVGGPGAGAAVAALVADGGSFTGILGALKTVVAQFLPGF